MSNLLTKKQVEDLTDLLATKYIDDKTMLHFTTTFELLVATILSAQCTDVRVNKVTDEMFKKYNKPEDFASLTQEELEAEIKTCGLYKTKAKNILKTSRMLIDDFGGEVPSTMEDLIKLPGVGRKTANVVLYNAFDIPAIAVDTHVFRVSNRLGIVEEDTVEKTEKALQKQIKKEDWGKMHHFLILLGRDTCRARNPLCHECIATAYCNYYKEKGYENV